MKRHKLISPPENLGRAVDEFIKSCTERGVYPYVTRFALEHGIHKDTLSEWARKHKKSGYDPDGHIARAVKRLRDANELELLDKLGKSKADSNAMFLLKCNHGYVEEQHVKHEHTGGVTIEVNTGVPEAKE